MANIYYDPEKFGLTVVTEVQAGSGYEFDTFVVWKDGQGRYVWEYDAGCSCPEPFDHKDLSTVRMGTARDALNDLHVWVAEEGYGHNRQDAAHASIARLLELIGDGA